MHENPDTREDMLYESTYVVQEQTKENKASGVRRVVTRGHAPG